MYNRILKRPMFRRGGSSFQSQGTGITSPYDVPRGGYYGGGTIGGGAIRGNPMGYRTGFEEPVLRSDAEVQADIVKLTETPKGTWLDDVIGSFGAYSTPYKDDGTAKTIGEMGAEQAEEITAIRKARKEKQDLAKLAGYERELSNIDKQFTKASEQELVILTNKLDKETKLAVEEAKGNNLDVIRRIGILEDRLKSGKISQSQYDDGVNSTVD